MIFMIKKDWAMIEFFPLIRVSRIVFLVHWSGSFLIFYHEDCHKTAANIPAVFRNDVEWVEFMLINC
jgi:hypothetical protein